MRVCITIDTEFSIAGAFADAARRPVGAPMVSCEVVGRSQGLGFLLDCFRRHGVQATFFVETAQRFYFREDDPMAALAQQAAAAGHEVQLHVHPCWGVFRHDDWRERVREQPRQDDFVGRSVASTLALLRHGQQSFAQWGLPAPQVFRAGNLQYDDGLYRALAAAGIPYSSNIGLGVYDGGLAEYSLYAGRHLRHGVVECPVLTYRDWGSHLKSAAVSSSSFAEMCAVLDQAHAAGLELVVILTHPFEYVHGDADGRMRRHALNQARMERLCAYLAAHPARFQPCGMAAAAGQPLTATSSQNPLLIGRPWRAASRLVTQSVYQRYSSLALAAKRPLADTASLRRGPWRGEAQPGAGRWALPPDAGRSALQPDAGRDAVRRDDWGEVVRRGGWRDAGWRGAWRGVLEHGSWRGAVRAWLGRVELRAGRLGAFRLRHPQRVRRVVFVCLGNICRSAYAQRVAERLGMQSVSIGLATVTGAPSPDAALRAAQRCGEDLCDHRATSILDFEPQAGDLFLAMEIRHAHELQRRLFTRDDVQIALLGLWCDPPSPHLHDPYTLSDAYFELCFARLRQAVQNLHHDLQRSAP
jgi:protein-tyrosine-phosphatase/peptidoglycan/xylan/chitin deacetylase (PgdA/CDA1 family)